MHIKLEVKSKNKMPRVIIIGIRNYFKTAIRQCDIGAEIDKRTMKENRESADRPFHIKSRDNFTK